MSETNDATNDSNNGNEGLSKKELSEFEKILEGAIERERKREFVPEQRDSKADKEQDYLFRGGLDNINDWIKHEEFRLKLRVEDQNLKLREKNIKPALWFSLGWALFITIFICANTLCDLPLTPAEYIATIGSLSATILTYYLVVIKHLFNRGK